MAEITKHNGLGVLLENTEAIVDLGNVKPEDTLSWEFKFLGSADQIEYVEKGCGCTSAFYKDGKIMGELNMATAGGSREYKQGETPINKSVFVWLNDGHTRFISDDLKQKKQNPLKSWFRLNISATVVVD